MRALLALQLTRSWRAHALRLAEPDAHQTAVALFMAFIVAARVGLYDFELGCIEIQQRLVDATTRSSLGSVESALCAFFTLIVYAMATFVPDIDFGLLVTISTVAVTTAAAIHWSWLAMWHEEEHSHDIAPIGVSDSGSEWDESESRALLNVAGDAGEGADREPAMAQPEREALVLAARWHPHTTQHVPSLSPVEIGADMLNVVIPGPVGASNVDAGSDVAGMHVHTHPVYRGPRVRRSRVGRSGGPRTRAAARSTSVYARL